MASLAPSAENSSRKPTVVIVDDHIATSRGLHRFVEQLGYRVCGEADNGIDAKDLIRTHAPDIAIIDLNLKTANGIVLTREVLAEHPRIAVLIVSLHSELIYAEPALRAGAKGYLMKADIPDRLEAVLAKLTRGETYTGALVDYDLTQPPRGAPEPPTA